jgi:plastocyanin
LTTDAGIAGLTINEIAYSAITRLEVTAPSSAAYVFTNQYSGNNPTIYAISGTTIAFNLDVAGHPFLIKTASGASNYNIGLIHVAVDGTLSTGSSAQGKVSGTLYWQVPANINGAYSYQCSIHSGMLGVITVKDISAI